MIRTGQPISRQPVQRYWRRRANRPVRRARLVRSLLRWSALGLAQLAFASVLLYAAVRVFLMITSAQEFALVQVEIEGVRRASAAQIRAQLEAFRGRNLLELNLGEIAAVLAADPWVLEASAKRVFPDTLRIRITERRPSALALIGGTPYVIDATGRVIGPAGPGTTDDLPILTGLDGLADDELNAELRRGASLIDRLRQTAHPWIGEISEFDLKERDRIIVRTVDPGPLLLLDPTRAERNLPEYLELRRDIARRVGSMEYVDLRWADHIAVKPKNPAPSKEDS